MSRTRKARPARLDQDGTAKPLTQIKPVYVPPSPSGKVRQGPGYEESYVIHDVNPHTDG